MKWYLWPLAILFFIVFGPILTVIAIACEVFPEDDFYQSGMR